MTRTFRVKGRMIVPFIIHLFMVFQECIAYSWYMYMIICGIKHPEGLEVDPIFIMTADSKTFS